MIWEYSIPESRVVNIQARPLALQLDTWLEQRDSAEVSERPTEGNRIISDQQLENLCDTPEALMGIWSSSPIPVLLLVCRESNDVASKYYTPAFSTPFADACTYFDFERDILYLRYNNFLGKYSIAFLSDLSLNLNCMSDNSELRRVRNLAILVEPGLPGEEPIEDHKDYLLYEIGECLRLFGGVKNLTLVIPQDHLDDDRDVSYYQSGLWFVDPFNIDSFRDDYESFKSEWMSQPRDYHFCSDYEIDYSWAEVDMETWRIWKAELDTDYPLDWVLPENIKYRTAITPGEPEQFWVTRNQIREDVWSEVLNASQKRQASLRDAEDEF